MARREHEEFNFGMAGALAMFGFIIGCLAGLFVAALLDKAVGLFGWHLPVQTIAVVVGAGGALVGFAKAGSTTVVEQDYYCADCGNSLGTEPRSCARCGCNRYTTEDSGVGRRVRRG